MDLEIGYLDMLRSQIVFSTLLHICFFPLSMSNIVIIEVLVKLILSVLENNKSKNLNVSHRLQKYTTFKLKISN